MKQDEFVDVTATFTSEGTFMVEITAISTDGTGDETDTNEISKTTTITVSAES